MAVINQEGYANLQALLTDESWRELIGDEFKKPYWSKLTQYLDQEVKNKEKVYPDKKDIFNAFNLCPVKAIRVVIIGQDPYIFRNQAHGLCFSVKAGVRFPPSLLNIFKELKDDLKDGFDMPTSGDLTLWAQRGVFLLNTSLTVRAEEPGSHLEKGWKDFTSTVISKLSRVHPHLIFVLWGSHAQQAAMSVDRSKHFLIKAAHPSPKSADRGFFGSKFASTINKHLMSRGESPLEWNLVIK